MHYTTSAKQMTRILTDVLSYSQTADTKRDKLLFLLLIDVTKVCSFLFFYKLSSTNSAVHKHIRTNNNNNNRTYKVKQQYAKNTV